MTAQLYEAGTISERAREASRTRFEAHDRSASWRNMSSVILVPTRGMVHIEVVNAWMSLALPMNQRCAGFVHVRGMEVAAAYNELVGRCVDEETARAAFGSYGETVRGSQFLVTLEDDNIPPSDAILRLLEEIHRCPDCGGAVGEAREGAKSGAWVCEDGHKGYDAVSGLYWTKDHPSVPLALGDPNDPEDFRPRRVKDARDERRTIEVNAIPMGCAVWRRELFEKVSRPWFQTLDGGTQDVYFCKKAKQEVGARFGVACYVDVAHMDVRTGERF